MLDSLYCEWLEVAASNELAGSRVAVFAGTSEVLAGVSVLEGTCTSG